MTELKPRKCAYCGNTTIPTVEQFDFVVYKSKSYHIDCFKKLAEERVAKNNSHSLTWQDALDNIDEMANVTKKKACHCYFRDELNKYLIEQYDVSTFSERFWSTIEDIDNGKFRSKSCKPLYVTTLLEMWKFSKKKIDDTYVWNKSHGKDMSGEIKARYDLSIVMGNYNNFIKYKAKSKGTETETQAAKETVQKINSTNYEYLSKQATSKDKESDNDILELMNEIF